MFYILFLYLSICGELANVGNAIPLNGEKIQSTTTQEFPFVASLQKKIPRRSDVDKHFCTGSLITTKDILSAAHCIAGETTYDIQVVFGAIKGKKQKYDVKWMVTYDLWAHSFNISQEFTDNDVAILRLSTVVSQANIKPAILSGFPTAHLYRTKAVMVGWDFVTKKSVLAKRLRKAEVDIYTPEVCERQVYLVSNQTYVLERNLMCTAAEPFVLTNCGDSGGPLLNRQKDLIGITHGGCIEDEYRWGDFSKEFINKYEINMHSSIEYYRNFINAVTEIQ